jgi:hypothetical protein
LFQQKVLIIVLTYYSKMSRELDDIKEAFRKKEEARLTLVNARLEAAKNDPARLSQVADEMMLEDINPGCTVNNATGC